MEMNSHQRSGRGVRAEPLGRKVYRSNQTALLKWKEANGAARLYRIPVTALTPPEKRKHNPLRIEQR